MDGGSHFVVAIHLLLYIVMPIYHYRGLRLQILKSYFNDTFTHYNFFEEPAQIFNVDETGMSLNPDCTDFQCR